MKETTVLVAFLLIALLLATTRTISDYTTRNLRLLTEVSESLKELKVNQVIEVQTLDIQFNGGTLILKEKE